MVKSGTIFKQDHKSTKTPPQFRNIHKGNDIERSIMESECAYPLYRIRLQRFVFHLPMCDFVIDSELEHLDILVSSMIVQ